MPEKRSVPLDNPPQEKRTATATYPCPYCKWVGVGVAALSYHVNHYHEAVVAAEGERVRERGGADRKLAEQARWGGDYIRCYRVNIQPPDLVKVSLKGAIDYIAQHSE